MNDKQTAEEILDKCHWDFVVEKGISSIHPKTFPEAYKQQALRAMEAYASQPSAGLEIDTFPFCERGGKWFYCYKDIKGLNQHSKLFDSWGEAIQSYNEWHFVKADDIPTPSAGLGDVKLPDFLYKSGNEICIGYHGDSLVTDEWNEWLEKHLPKLKALTSLPSGYCRWVRMVYEWHLKFGVDVGKEPKQITLQRFEMRQNILLEEVKELEAAYYSGDIVEVSDAIADILYVIIGTAIEFGLHNHLDKIFEEVHRSNMSKLDEDGNPVVREDGKIMKSKLFSPPNITAILEESPSTIDARKIASDAWDAAIERFCYENGSEFVEGKPLKKFDYLSNL